MPKKVTKIGANLLDMVYLIDENEVREEMGAAFASVMVNPIVTWVKFVLTDDRRNGNGQRVPKEEFANLIRSGLHMPVKMALGEIKPGHDDSRPLGAITHLKEITTSDGTNAILALAALWNEERPADIEYIKTRFAEKKPVDISWEIIYTDETFNVDMASKDLLGTFLQAATIVGNPAYEGRTPFLAIAAKTATAEEEIETVPETIMEEESMDTTALEAKVAELEAKLAEKETALAERDAEISRLAEEASTKETELASLREYKDGIEAEIAKAEKLESIKTKFGEAGLTKADEYFVENAEKFLKMDADSLEFMIQELAARLETEESKTSSASKSTKIPALTGNEDAEKPSVSEIAKYLRERKNK